MQNIFKGFFIEINLRKKKWLLSCSYNSNRKNIVDHTKNISTRLDQFSATYNNLILIGDFNLEFNSAIKQRYNRANQSSLSFMIRELSKAIMKRSNLRNIFQKEKVKFLERLTIYKETIVLIFCGKIKGNLLQTIVLIFCGKLKGNILKI